MEIYTQKKEGTISFLLNDHQSLRDIISVGPKTEPYQHLDGHGCSSSINESDVLYQFGIEFFKRGKIKKCYSDAVYCFLRAVQLNHVEANNMLGLCYLFCLGTKKSQQEAISCIQEAADAGSPFAQYNLALLKHDQLNNLEKAAKSDFALAQNALGRYYYNESIEEKRSLAPK